MQADVVAQGWELLLYGMGTVVLFLGVLVVAATVMSRLIGRFFPEPEVSASAAAAAIKRLRDRSQPADDPNLVAVIGAAVHRYRSTRRHNDN